MRTRTLLLLALGCAVAIMVAGAVFLLQLAGQDEPPPPASLGEAVRVADMTVVVTGVDERPGHLAATVTLGGVEDADGGAGFRLIASGRQAPRVTGSADDCAATTLDTTSCVVSFDVSAADGSSRVLFYERGDDQARWVLGGDTVAARE